MKDEIKQISEMTDRRDLEEYDFVFPKDVFYQLWRTHHTALSKKNKATEKNIAKIIKNMVDLSK
jgi:hypothetical protein